VDKPVYRRWLADVAGYPEAELETVQRTLRIRDQGAPSRPPAKSRWQYGAGPVAWAAVGQIPDLPAPVEQAEGLSHEPSPVPAVGSEEIKTFVLAAVSEKTGYPVEMLDLDLDLEADLGIDTVKQAELFAAMREHYSIPRREDLRLSDYNTLAKVIGFVEESLGAAVGQIVNLSRNALAPAASASSEEIKTYLLAIIDDATRLVVHAEFYDNQRLPVLEDSLRKAIIRCGCPDNLYVDNGKIFISQWLRLACAKLGIRHMSTQAYSPEAKGKIERFNRTVEEFLAESRLEKPPTLEQLNELFRVWLSEGYNHREHSALSGKSPAQSFAQDAKTLRFLSPEALRDAFLWEKTPKVDKSGCFSLEGLTYEAGVDWIGKKILVRYDPFDLSVVEVWYAGKKERLVSPANIGEYNHNLKKPVAELEKASQSKLLRLFASDSQKRLKQELGAFRLSQEKEYLK
jgi:acyl carrier protein